jgi:hypothetical protein
MEQNMLQPTDYSSLHERIEGLLAEPLRQDYDACFTTLVGAMREQFPALTRDQNPVNVNLGTWSKEQLGYIIQEYSGFSNAAIHMFLEARIRNHWPALAAEITRNMDEEMGILTRGIPHLELMRHGYRAELGIETDGLRYSPVTDDFIDRMNGLFRTNDNANLAGVLLAFEATAVDEFRIVERMLRRYKEMVGGEIAADSLTGEYIAGHVVPGASDVDNDPEMDHCLGMMRAVGTDAPDQDLQPVVRGFLSVCLELNRWWEQLACDTIQRDIRQRLVAPAGDNTARYSRLLRLAA